MLLAWVDRDKGEEHPQVPECQRHPGWLAYALGHGARVRIDINGDKFIFVFADAAAPSPS